MFHKVNGVIPKNNYILQVTFKNGKIKNYDVKPLFNKYDVFNDLKIVPGLFEQAKADIGGYGISWNDEIDLACDELWENGTDVLITAELLN